jgi:flavin-dependent dehydrogenase
MSALPPAEVAICGAGPAGSALAGLLAREGVDVLVLDRVERPEAVVGESLLPFGNRVLERLGVSLDGFVRKRGAVFTAPGSGAEGVRIDFSEAARPRWTFAHQVRRELFDARLRAAAEAAGARFEVARVTSVQARPGDRIEVGTDRGPVRAGRVVDALGRDGAFGKALGLRRQHPLLRNAARSMWYRGVRPAGPEQEGDIVICCFDGGWFWLIPLGDGVTSVGAVTTRDSGIKGGWEEALARCDAAQARLEGAEPVGPMRGHQDFSAVTERFWGEGWAVCGDAAVFVDPVFSSGVLLGLEGAAGLCEVLLGRGTFEAWQASVLRASKAFETVALSFYDRSFLTVLFAAEHRPAIRAEIVALLAGDVWDHPAPARIAARLGDLARRLERT